jgi:tRNA dimethylallyltransferase
MVSGQGQVLDHKPGQVQPATVVFLMGPTGAGKTDIAVALVARRACDIISVDSALIYKGMDIGTAKPDEGVLARAPHRLINLCDPSERYSAARFRADACVEIDAILAQGRTPLLVGGTMMYFRALANGLSTLPTADTALRQRLELQASSEGWASMHQRLDAVDPLSAQRIHPNDPQRIMRALEVYEMTGIPLSSLQGQSQALPYRIIRLVVAPAERKVLHQRIEQRFHTMMERGFLAEVEGLFSRSDLNADLPSMRAVGYRQLWAYLSGDSSLETAVQRGMTATRQLAKRQLTWLRSEPEGTKWFDGSDKNMLSNILKSLGDAQ